MSGCGKWHKAYENEDGEVIIHPMRCNDRIGCPICAREYSRRKRKEIGDLLNALIESQGIATVLYGELTIPKKFSLELEKTGDRRKAFVDAGCRAIKRFYPKAPIYVVYHNWGKKSGAEANWHLHFLILPWMPDGKQLRLFIDRDDLLRAWREELVIGRVLRENQASQITVVNLERIMEDSLTYEHDLFNRLEYMVRQPIEDIEIMRLTEVERLKFFALVRRIPKNFRRFRRSGWMSNRNISKALAEMSIKRVERKKALGSFKPHSTRGRIELAEDGKRVYKPDFVFRNGLRVKARKSDWIEVNGVNCRLGTKYSDLGLRYEYVGRDVLIKKGEKKLTRSRPRLSPLRSGSTLHKSLRRKELA